MITAFMTRAVALLLTFGILLPITGHAQAAPVEAEIAPTTVREDVFPKPSVRFAGGIVAQPDIEYANFVGFRPLLLDLYAHEQRERRRPLVIWVHGGGWSRGDSRTSAAYADFPAVLASLAARGYVVASVNYRLSGEARFPAAIRDVKAAIRYLRAHAADYGIDPGRVILWGGSAGGHLAALAATSCGLAAFEPPVSTGRFERSAAATGQPVTSDCVQGAVIWYGVLDLPTSISSSIPAFIGCRPLHCPELAAFASPTSHADRSDPPMLLIHGTADRTSQWKQSELMATRLRTAGVPVETLFIPDIDHGWLGKTPAATRAASLLALQRTFDFIDATVGR